MNGVNQDAIIADEIRLLIDEGFYQQGDKLPSELELCKKYNVQKMTIRSSLQILKDEGIIKAKKNSGHYVERKRISSREEDCKLSCEVSVDIQRRFDKDSDLGVF